MRIKVLLASENPHPRWNDRTEVNDWWGREIEVMPPEAVQRTHACGTEFVWEVVGPQEFIDLIGRHRYLCAHHIDWTWDGNFVEADYERIAV